MISSRQIKLSILIAIASAILFGADCHVFVKIVAIISAWLALGGYYTLYIAYYTLGRDLRAAKMFIRLGVMIKVAELKNLSVAKMFKETVRKHPNKPMFLFEDTAWTFKQVDEYSNQIAHFFQKEGFSKGDCIGLFMENRPEYAAIWLGLSKIGIITALINNNLMKESLIHSITVPKCKALIFGAELSNAVQDILDDLPVEESPIFPMYISGLRQNAQTISCVPNAKDLDSAISSFSKDSVSKEIENSIGFKDKLLYVYTSGTTGMPKAAIIKHSRYILASGGSHIIIGCLEDDIVYSPLPLYHTVAGMVTLSGAMHFGFTMVLRKKFSASEFWSDCIKYKVTAAQYIGEICRYLLSRPESEKEKLHSVRLMFGNGLRPQLWKRFVERFKIKNLAEYYGSTEGNSQIINNENKEGAVGYISVLFPNILPLGLIKINDQTGAELRDENGLCIPCKPGEPGEFVGKIVRNHPIKDFHGYSDEKATGKKLLRDVFNKGDLYFRSGDVLVMDEFGWLYFRDRSGDTFRWKGENVSTAEVECVISNILNLKDVIVYGVEVPGCEGKAGMAAIADLNGATNLNYLSTALKERLPAYSRPLFLRLVDNLELTGSFKLKKFKLQAEGFNPRTIEKPDQLYFLSPETSKYEPLDFDMYDQISNGKIRL